MGAHQGFSKILIVEGIDDRHSVVGLMKSHIDWPEKRELWPVYVDLGKSVSEILHPPFLRATLKEPGVLIVGIMLDADDNKPASRYQSIRDTCIKFFPTLPEKLPPEGIVVKNLGGAKMGVWIMPDNTLEGCLETFLRYLVPDKEEPIWKLATESVQVAMASGAMCPQKDIPKANLYTWLAWQSIPGQRPGLALTKLILNPYSPYAAPFVKWFRDLYEV